MPFGRITTSFYPGAFDPRNPLQWEEHVDDHGDRIDTITHGESLSTIRGYVLSHDLILSALAYWLGWAYVDYGNGSADPVMKRYLPSPHPENNQLFAKRVQIRGWKYSRKERLQALPNPIGNRVPYGVYEKYLFEIDFEMVGYDVLPDGYIKPNGQPINDWERFVTTETDDDTEITQVDGGQYFLRAAGSNPNLDGMQNVINGPLMKKYVERSILTVTAHQLPYDLIYNSANLPIKLMKARGKVNGDPNGYFLGTNSQTMVLLSSKQKKYVSPVATTTWTVLQFGVDIEFKFGFQEPTKAISTETQAGWNLVPGLGPNWGEGWYGAGKGATTGPAFYPRVDMLKLLTHWSLNDLNYQA